MPKNEIIYIIPKDIDTQAMKMQGAVEGFRAFERFLQNHAFGLSYGGYTLDFFVAVKGKKLSAEAKELRAKLMNEFGWPQGISSWYRFKLLIEDTFFPGLSFWESYSWNIKHENLSNVLEYVDMLGKLPNLELRPPVYVSVFASFWLSEERVGDLEQHSMAVLYLSPSSDKVSLGLHFPFDEAGPEFEAFRRKLQKDIPVEFKDKYFLYYYPSGATRKVYK